MPAQKGKSPLLAKYGDKIRRAAEAHRNDEVEYSQFGELPAGIDGGIAQLVDCKFVQIKEGKQNAGEYMFYAAGVVKSPVEVDGQRVEGLRTQISEPIFDTPARSRETTEEHVAWIQNQMKMLGVGPENLGGDDLEATAAALKEAGPHFKFRTWKGEATKEYPNPRVNHSWNGLTDWNGEAVDRVQDNTVAHGAEEEEEEIEGDTSSSPADADGSLTELAEAADGGDEEAQDKLRELALQAGFTDEEVDSAASWREVVEMITNPAGGVTEEGPSEEEEEPEPPKKSPPAAKAPREWKPAKEEIYLYRPLDLKTKKPVKKAVECEVTAMDAKTRTVTLKSLDNPKVFYKSVKWESLEGE